MIFDIETCGYPEAELTKMCPPFNADDVKLGALKDPDKIKAKLREAEANHLTDFIAEAALYPERSRVACIPFKLGETIGVVTNEAFTDDAERAMLTKFWAMVYECAVGPGHQKVIGFNIQHFDVMYLRKRSWILGVKVPLCVWKGRYMGDVFVDLMLVWLGPDYNKYASLDSVARSLGCKSQKQGTGADFPALWLSDRAKAIEYARNDIVVTAEVAEKMQVE